MKGNLTKTDKGWIVWQDVDMGTAQSIYSIPLAPEDAAKLEPAVLGEYGDVVFDIVGTNSNPRSQAFAKLLMTERDVEAMLDAINNPPKPNEALVKAAKEYKLNEAIALAEEAWEKEDCDVCDSNAKYFFMSGYMKALERQQLKNK